MYYIEHQLLQNILHRFSHYSSFMKSSLNWGVSFILSKLSTGNFLRYCPSLYIIYIPILKIWQFSIFSIVFHVFVINFCILINRVAYSSCNTFFYLFLPLITYQYQLKHLITFLSISIAACRANPGAERNFARSNVRISRHIFLKFSNTIADNSVSLWIYKLQYLLKIFILKFSQTFFLCIICISNI